MRFTENAAITLFFIPNKINQNHNVQCKIIYILCNIFIRLKDLDQKMLKNEGNKRSKITFFF